ncbi:heat-shock protein HtpX [Cryobacterium algoricola]|uniref:arsenate reductase/protein-tyrosine-phosphatase family protein n=1 Tax=Cryobacterium algoricola TaxID=1259183 RepID=UPI00141BF241|nr:heat-shock protein HtpX [Cryobacterium algoricola]
MSGRPEVLFVCRHNSGRSQIAAGLMRARFGDVVTVLSGGIEPADAVNPHGAAALLARGIDIRHQLPRRVTDDELRTAAVVVTLVDGIELPRHDGVRHERWILPDPAQWSAVEILPLVDDIEHRVSDLATRV